MRLPIPILLLLILPVLMACGEDDVQIRVPLVYDDFSSGTVIPSKWTVDTTGGGTLSVANGKATQSVNTTLADMRSRLLFPTPLVLNIRTVAVRVRPLSYFEGGAGSVVRFRLSTWVYKDDGLVGAGQTSDIFSQIRIRAGQFQAMVSRCTSNTCGTSTAFLGPFVMGIANLNQVYDMSMTWDGGTGFSYLVDGVGSTSFDASVGGAFIKIAPAFAPRSLIEVNASDGLPNTGNMTVEVDHVICQRHSLAPC